MCLQHGDLTSYCGSASKPCGLHATLPIRIEQLGDVPNLRVDLLRSVRRIARVSARLNLTDEAALFHLLNLVREQRLQILMTTNIAPGDLSVSLPDLMSRLKALPVASIEAPDDALLRAVLVKLFADRQLSVEPHVIDYVLVRMERSLAAAERLVAEADRQALVLQRRVTRAVAAAALDKLEY